MSHRISVLINRAEGLRAADSNGKSDPYVVYGRVAPKAETHKTKVIEKTLDPVWNEVATWVVASNEPDWKVGFDIYDKDPIGKDFLGYAEIDLKKELSKEKTRERTVVLELGPGPKTSEKTAKKVTGKLHIQIMYPSELLNGDAEAKPQSQTDVMLTSGANAEIAERFHETSGGSDTIADKAKMARLAADPQIFNFIASLSANDDVTRSSPNAFRYTDEIIREIVTESDLVDYWSRIMLIITDCKNEGTITLAKYVARYPLVDRVLDYMGEYKSTPDRDKLVFELLDFDGDGVIGYEDLMAFQQFTSLAVMHKLEAEFLKDPKVATMKQKIGKFSYSMVISDMFKKFNFPATLRMMVVSLTMKVTDEVCNLVDIKYTPEQYLGFVKSEARRKEARAGASQSLTKMIKEHTKDAQIVLQKALQKHGIN